VEVIERDVAEPQGDLFRAGDAQTLPLLEDLDKVAGFDQRSVRSSVQPGEAAAQYLDKKVAAIEIDLVHVGYFQFAAWRGLQ
jgi:hypothetical protein